MIFRFLTSGESHGKGLNVIVEGMPAGVSINETFINNELKRRQKGYGRGRRMKIESDSAEILSGVRFSESLGSPICLFIKNKDFENWQTVMSTSSVEQTEENLNKINEKSISNVRPGVDTGQDDAEEGGVHTFVFPLEIQVTQQADEADERLVVAALVYLVYQEHHRPGIRLAECGNGLA